MTRPAAAARSYLYVPADRADRLERARDRGADALVLDLEDGVALSDKDRARDQAADWLGGQSGDGPQLWARVNAGTLEQDIAAVASPALLGVFVPKAEPESLALVDTLLTRSEQRLRFPNGRLLVLPLVESARGLLLAPELARAPRVLRLGIGEADLIAELGIVSGPDRSELAPLRLQVVVASAAAGITRPLAPTSTDFRDLDAFANSARVLLALGFRARTAVHPAQVAVINDVFTPSAAEVRAAADLVSRFESASGGVVTDAAGRMVDLAVVRGARELLARADDG
jgi:citrate lyase subunit beta / citryl-CoA lyase